MSIMTGDLSYEYLEGSEEQSEMAAEEGKASVLDSVLEVLLKIRLFYL